MNIELPGGNRERRRAILRGVYEENLRIDRRSPVAAAPLLKEGRLEGEERTARRQEASWGPPVVVVLLAGLLVGAAGLLLQQLPAGSALVEEGAVASTPLGRPVVGAPRLLSPQAEAEVNRQLAEAPAYEPIVTNADLSVARLFGLEVQTVVIDPGHGGEPGAVGPTGLEEQAVTLDVARRLRDRLEQHGYRVLMTREWDERVSLRERAEFANTHEADLFISIHVNALPAEQVNSIETYYFSARAEDAATLRLAEQENEHSGYSLSDFSDMIRQVGSTMRRQESKQLATAIQQNLYQNVRKLDSEVSDWGVKTAPFVVLLGVEAPSVLAEIGVISHPGEEAKLRTAAYRKKLAAFLEAGIVDYLTEEPQATRASTAK